MLEKKSNICFAILVHENRNLIKQLIENVQYFCPNSKIVLYNGGNDPTLCEGLGVPVCPTSRKLKYGWTTIYFLETMEWLEELGIQYEYFINIDSDALFIRKGYEEFIQTEMVDTDYMAVNLRIAEEDWPIGKELKKDIDRWKELFIVNPFYGIFNVGQVFSRSFVKALLEPELKQRLKNALLETRSFGTDEILFVNMAKELGFRTKKYPITAGKIRYRPYFTLVEMIHCLNNRRNVFLCHPVIRDENDPVRKLINHISGKYYTNQYKDKKYPWYQKNPRRYAISPPIKSKFGNLELIVRSNSSLTHYWKNPNGNWSKSETFAKGVTGDPVFFENKLNQFWAVCKLKTGGVGYWWRDNKAHGHPWYGPFVLPLRNVDPLMGCQLEDGKHIIVFKSKKKFIYRVLDK